MMNSRSSCNRVKPVPATDGPFGRFLMFGVLYLLSVLGSAMAAEAPQWMRAAASAPLPTYDEKTDAVLLYSERAVSVQSLDKIKTRVRLVYKILRPSGRDYGV